MKNDRLIDLGLTGYEELFMSTEERLNAKTSSCTSKGVESFTMLLYASGRCASTG